MHAHLALEIGISTAIQQDADHDDVTGDTRSHEHSSSILFQYGQLTFMVCERTNMMRSWQFNLKREGRYHCSP